MIFPVYLLYILQQIKLKRRSQQSRDSELKPFSAACAAVTVATTDSSELSSPSSMQVTASSSPPSFSSSTSSIFTTPSLPMLITSFDSNEEHQQNSLNGHEVEPALNVHAQDQHLSKQDCWFFHFKAGGCQPKYPCNMRHCFRSLGVIAVCQDFVNARSCSNPSICCLRHPAKQPKHESHRPYSSRGDKAERERDRDRDGRRHDRHSRK